MDAAIRDTRLRRVHTPTRIHDHPDRVQLRMGRSKNILISIKEQARGIEVVLRIFGIADLVLQRRLGELHRFFVLFTRLDELGLDFCWEEEEEPWSAHRGAYAPAAASVLRLGQGLPPRST